MSSLECDPPEYEEYNITLLIITTATILLQFYVIFVIIYVSPKSMSDFRYFLCLISIWDLIFTALLGYGLHPVFLFPMSAAEIDGLLKYLGPIGANIGFCMIIFAAANVLNAQMFCLMFRFTVVLPNPKIHEWFMKPVSLILMQIYCIAFSSAYAIPLYSIILKDKELVLSIKGSSQYFNLPLPKPNSIIIAVNFNHPESLALLNGTGRYAIAIVVGLLSIQIFCVGITFYIIKKLRQNAHLFSRKTYTLQIQFTLVLAFQLVSPLIFFLAPICYSLIRAVIHASIFDRLSGNIGTVLLSLYTFSNSLVTVMFVRPYRNYTLAKFGICFGRKCQEFMRQHSQLSGPKLRTNNTSVISVSSGFAYVQHGNAQTQ